MSVFNKVIEAHAKAKTKAEHVAAAAATARTAAETKFAAAFAEQIEQVAAPVFEEFAADAIAHDFPAVVENANDGAGNPIYAVKLVPETGAKFGVNASEEIAYSIRGIICEQKVEHTSYFDQRPNKKHCIKKGTFGIQSINTPVLERELGEFLSAALKARAA